MGDERYDVRRVRLTSRLRRAQREARGSGLAGAFDEARTWQDRAAAAERKLARLDREEERS